MARVSIHEGSIYCCSKNGIKLLLLHIGHGAFGLAYKAMKTVLETSWAKSLIFSDTAVAVMEIVKKICINNLLKKLPIIIHYACRIS